MLNFDNTEIAFAHKSKRELFRAYWLFRLVSSPALVTLGKVLVNVALTLRIPIGWALKGNIFAQFCGGETIADCATTTQVLDRYRIGTILDYSVEGKETERDFDANAEEILRTIETAHGNPHIPFCVFKVTGIARFGLLQKLNENQSLNTLEAAEFDQVKKRINRIAQRAYDTGTPLFIDAEESWIQNTIDQLCHELMQLYNGERAIIYNTAQMYRHDRLDFLKSAVADAQEHGYHYGVKLVRGAYMEKERDRAADRGYASPIQATKAATDRDFDAAIAFCIEHINHVAFCAGSHNENSAIYLAELMAKHGLNPNDDRVYFAQLYGMSDHISFNLSHAGYNVAKYVPYGPIREVIPYLIRRAEENTSVKGQTGRELSLILRERARRKAQ
jgi:proline dehydrogenase